MKETSNLRDVTLKELWNIFTRRLPAIVLAAVLVAGSLFVLDRVSHRPLYASTATLYLVRDDSNPSTNAEAYNEFTLAMKVVYDCNYLLKSRTVVDHVIQEQGLDYTYKELYGRISTYNPTNTRILEVTVEAESPAIAKQIVDGICQFGQVRIADAMGFNQVNIYELGTLPTVPCNRTALTTFILAGAAAAVLTYGFYLLLFLLDDRLRSAEDLEKHLGLSILAEIPDSEHTGGFRYGYGYGSRYGYSAAYTTKKSKTSHSAKGKKRS